MRVTPLILFALILTLGFAQAATTNISRHTVTSTTGFFENNLMVGTLVNDTTHGLHVENSSYLAGSTSHVGTSWFDAAATFNGTSLAVIDFTNAQHDHGDANDGGTIPFTSSTGVTTRAQLPSQVAYEDEINTFSIRNIFQDGLSSLLSFYGETIQANRTLIVKQNTYSEGAARFNGSLIVENGGLPGIIINRHSTDDTPPGYYALKTRGTETTPTNVVNGDNIFQFQAQAYSGTVFSVASILGFIDGAFTSGERPPSGFTFNTNVANSPPATRWTFKGTGDFLPGASLAYDIGSATLKVDDIFSDTVTITAGIVPGLVSGSTTTRTPTTGVAVTPSTTRPVFVVMQGGWSSSTAAQAGNLVVTCDGIASNSLDTQNPLAAGSWVQDVTYSCYIPPGASYTMTTSGTGTWVIRAVETVT